MLRIPDDQIASLTHEQKRALLARLLKEGTARDGGEVHTLHGRVERICRQMPEAVAVVAENQRWTYRELEARSDELACHLQVLGARPGALVGIDLEPAPDRLAAVLAVLKVGGGYLPLESRGHSGGFGPSLILTQESRLDRAVGALSVCLESLSAPVGPQTREPSTDPESLACAFSAGDSGDYVGIRHGVLVSVLDALRSLCGLTQGDVFAAVAPLGSSRSVLELFLPLTLGARVHLIDPEVASDGLRLAEELDRQVITVFVATPEIVRSLHEADWRGRAGFSTLCHGPGALSPEIVRSATEQGGSLWRLFGSPETAFVHALAKLDGEGTQVPVGRPIGNSRLYVLDAALQPLPSGVVGELYVGGQGLPQGYLNRADGDFPPDPFAGSAAKMFPTRELARYRLDGALEFLGRASERTTASRRNGHATPAIAPPPRRRAEGEKTALSFAQHALWLLDQLTPGAATFNVMAAVRIKRPLDLSVLEQSFRAMIRRHEALRTTFAVENGEPIAIVGADAPLAIEVVDLRPLPLQEREAAASRHAVEESRRPFDLSRGPLIRAVLIVIDDHDHTLVFTMHHIVTDGWSLEVVARELMAHYEAILTGQPSPLPEPSIQYADYAQWQRATLQGEARTRLLDYWTKQLEGLSPLDLPADRPRPQAPSGQGGYLTFTMPRALVKALDDLSRREGATLFMMLLAAFQTVLHRYSGQTDVTIGTSIANRNQPGVEGLIGHFVNLLVIRADLSGDPGFRELLGRVREVVFQAFEHQDLPFELLVEAIQPERDPSRSPLFQVLFGLHNYLQSDVRQSDAFWSDQLRGEGTATAKFDLTLNLEETDQGLIGFLEYSADLFNADTIERLAGHFQTLLEGIVSAPDNRLSTLPLLTDRERQSLPGMHPAIETGPPQWTIAQRFEQQAARTPEAVALVFEGASLSYRELNARSNQLAHDLRRRGVTAETPVGICVERSLEQVISVLAILKAGGAYVPLDPDYPRERLDFMREDSGIALLLTQRALADRLAFAEVECLALDTPGFLAGAPESNLAPVVTPENLAYVIYTSGSTGKPKGSLLTHACVTRLLTSTDDWFHFGPSDVWTLFHSCAFDFSVWELWGALLYGGRLVVVPYWVSRAPEAFHALLRREGVTVLNQTPSAFWGLVQADERAADDLPDLRLVIFGGEALAVDKLGPWFDRHGDVKPLLVNMYGITETTVHVTYRALSREDAVGRLGSPIGVAIPDLSLHVLDPRLQPIPVGIPGELCVGGPGLARGYHRRAGLTAEKFVADPFSTTPGARLYRSGDLVRFRSDGGLDYLGRIDHQVKIRGFRIELGEVEAALRRNPTVADAVVIERDQRLTAYVVAWAGMEASPVALRRVLQDVLPEYMVPSAFVVLPALPLTPSGKVDRKALPAPETDRSTLSRPFQPPRTVSEKAVAAIWSDILRVPSDRVGVLDDFFELGGHSLLATQVVSRLRDRLGVEVPLRLLFEARTIAALLEQVELLPREGPNRSAPPIVPTARNGETPLTFAQEALWFLEQLAPGEPTFNVTAAVRIHGPLDVPALERSFQEIMRRHESLRTTFSEQEGRPHAVILPDLEFPLIVDDLRSCPDEAQSRAVQEGRRPFDLARGPLARARLLMLGEDKHALLITMHHIITDGWSIWIAAVELSTLYEAFRRGEPSTLPALPIQYADFAAWQREWLVGDVLEELIEYWSKQLAGVVPLDLPTDRPYPPTRPTRGAVRRFAFPRRLSDDLKALGREAGVTPFMTLLAAFQTLLHRYGGQGSITVGSPIAHRNRVETEGLLGYFVNMLALRTDFSGRPTFRALLERVRMMTLAAYEHQDLPLEVLVERLNPRRDPSRTPLFQVMFVLQNNRLPEVGQVELALGPLRIDAEAGTGTAKFDLTLAVEETEDGLVGGVEFKTDLFDSGTIDRLIEHYRVLLEGIVANPDAKLEDLPVLSAEESRQVLEKWSIPAQVLPPPTLLVHEQFQARVDQAPDAIALVAEGARWTYRDLNARANQLAHHLIALGVGPESRVGLGLRSFVERVIGVLGTLKAGGAYVPLDLDVPAARLAFQVEDAALDVLLTEADWSGEGVSSNVLLERLDERINSQPIENLAPSAQPENLAYIIYTSGSTGRPKGVMISHASLAAASTAWGACYQLNENPTRHLQMAGFAFDVFTGDWARALCWGGTLVECPRSVLVEPELLYALMKREQIDCAEFVPAVAELLIDHLEANGASLDFLRLMIVGSDQLRAGTYERLRRLLASNARLVNSYGLTEATIDSTYFEGPLPASTSVPIGRPLGHARVYILDQSLNPVPVGVPGELCLGGEGLARGYHGRPGLTAERFVPSPFRETSGARIYRTGDRARWRTDGQVELLGRIDHQIKIRGFRIELGEIESELARHPSVREAAAIAFEDAQGEKRLAAYVVTRADEDLQAWLRLSLPDYMIPSVIVSVDVLPKTPSGKVDRAALPPPNATQWTSALGQVAPRTALEATLAAVWSEVLRRDQVGIHDNFFELGGHSLLAARVVSRLRQALDQDIPLRYLFEAPTVARLAERIAGVDAPGRQLPPIEPVGRDETLPLAFAQQSLWFLEQVAPGLPTFNVTAAVRFQGPLDLAALRHGLDEIVRRHESLRTTFATHEGRPVQVISPARPLALPVIDLRDRPSEARASEAERLTSEEARRPFDLARGPLVRAVLFSLDDEDHALQLTIHHIITDGWSLWVAARELLALYEAFRQGQPSPLAALPIQYADYAHWQRRVLSGEVLERQLAYWTRQLAGIAPLELPTDHPRPPVRSARGASLPFALPKELSDALAALALREGVTPFMTLLAAFLTVLHRYSGRSDLTVGTPVANRNATETEGLIGYFVNLLALRVDLSGDPEFRALLARVRSVALTAFEHQEVPFELVVESLQPQRDLSSTPLFQVLFVLQNTQLPETGPQDPALSAFNLNAGTGTAKFDLTMTLAETEQGLSGSLEFSTDLFVEETIARFLGHFQTLLEGIVSAPDARLSALPLLTADERAQVLEDWNSTRVDLPSEPIHALFEGQVERAPDALALVCEGQRLTYRELNARANQLARYLRRRGVGPEVAVGLCVGRSPELVVAVLGILKAGGAYIPLDPAYPIERLRAMTEDARMPLLITAPGVSVSLGGAGIERLCLNAESERIAEEEDTNLSVGPTAANLAYIIYTSGSTGVPKGVSVAHRGVTALARWARSVFRDDEIAGFLASTSICFDLSVFELFVPLSWGGTIILVDNILQLPTSAHSHDVTFVNTVPSVLSEMLRLGSLPRSVRTVGLAGEAVSTAIVRRLHERHGSPSFRVFDLYGPTEDTVYSTFALRNPDGPATIGRPIANGQAYVVDDRLNPVPAGVTGDLYLGGVGLARGYHRRPGLTAERFIPDPFSDEPGARLYRTGDRARWRSDGTLEFLGRSDHQVKIRGFRIELGEIETALRDHAGVAEAVVVAHADASGGKSLTAYLVVRSGHDCAGVELRRWLQASLPDYMIPSAFVRLDALPLTPGGKLNRSALPSPETQPLESIHEYVAPRSPLEEQLCRIWAEILRRDRVGVHDDFFELGGHSLQTMELTARLASALNREVTVQMILRAPTVAGLASLLESAPNVDAPIQASPLPRPSIARPQLPSHVVIEGRSFLELVAAGKLAPVDSVAVGYFNTRLLRYAPVSRETLVEEWCGGLPVVAGIRQTPLGRIGLMILPRFEDQLFGNQGDLLDGLTDALRVARHLGARTMALTGLLASATDYGRALDHATAGQDLPRVTTGHATTTSSVVLTIRHALEEAGRDLAREHVGFLGLGSIGRTTLRLLLACLPHPAELSLCDLQSKEDDLLALRREIVEDLGYQGNVHVIMARRETPDALYRAKVIVGATNVPEVLDIDKVAEGTILVDDSAPHCFRTAEALRRFQVQNDLLVTDGDLLVAPEPLPICLHFPRGVDVGLREEYVASFSNFNPRAITGCILSSLLSAQFADLPPTLGLIDSPSALRHYETLSRLGFRSAPLHMNDTLLDERSIKLFRTRFGNTRPISSVAAE